MNEVGCNEHVVTKPDHFIGAAEEIEFLPLQMSVSKAKTLRSIIMRLEIPRKLQGKTNDNNPRIDINFACSQ